MHLQELTVRDVMTGSVITVRESDAIGTADEQMHRARIRHLPVTETDCLTVACNALRSAIDPS